MRLYKVLMLLQNNCFPEDSRVRLEARCLREAGHSIAVISPTGFEHKAFYENIDGIHTYRYPRPPELSGLIGYAIEYTWCLTLTAIISLYVLPRRGFDVVHAHTPPDMFVTIALLYKLLGKQYVMDHHDLSPELYSAQRNGNPNRSVLSVLRRFERWSCRLADQLITTNQTQRNLDIERNGVDPAHTNIVRNGPDLRMFRELEPIADLRRSGCRIIGYLGIIGPQDGVDGLIRVLGRLRSDADRRDFFAVIVGSGSAVPTLKALVEELQLGDHVHFAGFQTGDRMIRHLATCDIFAVPDPVTPYNRTCTMIKTMEYMAMGRPMVGYDMPEHRHSAGDSSLYATPGDERHFARCLERLMDDAELRATMGRNGQRRVHNQLAWSHQEPKLLATYEKLGSRSPRRAQVPRHLP